MVCTVNCVWCECILLMHMALALIHGLCLLHVDADVGTCIYTHARAHTHTHFLAMWQKLGTQNEISVRTQYSWEAWSAPQTSSFYQALCVCVCLSIY
jgi:hypothetical protein